MNPLPAQDFSLYEVALSSNQLLTPLQVSPATLKSIVSSTIDLLIEQQIPATLWFKLPRGNTWQAEVRRYCELAEAPYTVYVVNNSREELAEEVGTVEFSGVSSPSPLTATNVSSNSGEALPAWAQLQTGHEATTPTPPPDTLNAERVLNAGLPGAPREHEVIFTSATGNSAILSITLAPESQLRREYFLLVVSPQFCSLALAHRPRSVRQVKPEVVGTQPTSVSGRQVSIGQFVEEDSLERKQPLLTLCSFNGQTIAKVLEGVRQAIAFSQSKASTPTDSTSDLTATTVARTKVSPVTEHGQINWDELLQLCDTHASDPQLLTQLFNKQVQRQEEVWHRTIAYRKQAEAVESLQLQNEELSSAIRLKDEFLNNVGQELRTPLTNMKTALTLLNSAHLKPAQRQRYMQLLSTECDRQSSLITSMLDLVQLEHAADHTNMQPLHLSDIVPGVVSTYQPLAQEKGVMLAYTVPENLPTVSCLSAWLKQIVINLIHNGIKFTPTGGQVWVRAKQQGDYLQLEFRDTGIGIPPNEIPKIFDRFYRVRHSEDFGGAGLGLTVVQQILLRCGGSISVKSKPGEGSTFNVLLPIYKNPTEALIH